MRSSSKHLLTVVSLLIVLAFLNTGIFSALNDTERSSNNKVTAYTPKMWKSTTEDDFYNNTTIVNVLTETSPGNVTLAYAQTSASSLYALAGGNTKLFYRYFISNNTWWARASTPQNVRYGGSMAFDESRYIYAIRGDNTRDFWRFDTQSNKWELLTNLPLSIGDGGFLRYGDNGCIYALIGGGTGTLLRYNITTQIWTTLTTSLPAIGTSGTPTVNDGASMIIYQGYVWIIRSDSGSIHTFIRVALDGTSWKDMNTAVPFNKNIGAGTSITHGQGAYLIATQGASTRVVFQYSITTNTWTRLGNTPRNMGLKEGSDLAYDNTRPWVTVGGGSKVLLRYDSTTRVWTRMAACPVAISYGANLLYVSNTIGYSSSGSLNSSVFDTGLVNAVYDSIFWDKSLPTGTSIVIKVRASNTRVQIVDPDDTANFTWDLTGTWTTVTGSSIGSITGQYVQWRVEMTTTVAASTPVLAEVRLYYRGF